MAGSTTGSARRAIPTWHASASASTANRSARSSLPRSRWRVILVRAVDDRLAVMLVSSARGGLLSGATSVAFEQDTDDSLPPTRPGPPLVGAARPAARR